MLGQNGQYLGEGRAINLMSYVMSDVDRDGADDYVAHVMCGEGPESPGWQVVAFRRSVNQLVPIGRVIGSQDGLAMMSGLEAKPGGRIAVNVSDQYVDYGEQYVPHQWRIYGWQGGRFRQVEGPTSFPAAPPAARLSVDPADLGFGEAQGSSFVGAMTVTARNSGEAGVSGAALTFILPREVGPAGDAWNGCTMARFAQEESVRIDCPLGGLAAHTSRAFTFEFVSDGEPRLVGGVDEPGRPSNHYLRIDQLPPYTLEVPQDHEANIRVIGP